MVKNVLLIGQYFSPLAQIETSKSGAKWLNIIHSANYTKSIAHIQAIKFDLIVMDTLLPDTEGLEVLSLLASHSPHVKVILVSELEDSLAASITTLVNLYELEVVASFSKSVNIGKLESLLLSILEQDAQCSQGLDSENVLTEDVASYPVQLVYQPQIDSRISQIVGYEVLSRWVGEDGVVHPPAFFLPMVEKLGAQKQFTKLVLERFTEDYLNGLVNLEKDIKFAINIDPNLLVDAEAIKWLLELKQTVIEHCIVLEITEHGLERCDHRQLLEGVLKLRLRGFEISVDDFGIEASNIERVMFLPINEIKIDRSLTWRYETNLAVREIVAKVKTLATAKKARLVFEGVETEDMRESLDRFGGYIQQGYLYSKPIPAALCTSTTLAYCLTADTMCVDKRA